MDDAPSSSDQTAERSDLAKHLTERIPAIIQQWQHRVRREDLITPHPDSLLLLPVLPHLLTTLAERLSSPTAPAAPPETRLLPPPLAPVAEPTEAALHRMTREFYVLRQTILDELPADLAPSRQLCDVVLDFIDQAVEEATADLMHGQQEGLRQSEELYRLLVESARDYAIFMLDPEGRVITWNPGAQRITGYTAEEIVGQDGAILFTPEDRARGEPAREIQTARRQGRAEDDRWHIRKDEGRFFASGVMMRLGDGELRGFAKVMRDITDRKQMEDALQERADALTAADRQKDQFLALLAHELRNPLMPIRNALELLKRETPATPAQQRAIRVIERQVALQGRLLDDLLNVNRILRGKVSLQRERLDLVQVVRTTVEDHRSLFEQARLTLEPDLPEQAVWVFGDPTRLAQVLGNLLQNAAKFTHAGGQVTIHMASEPERQEVAVTLRDTGVGISPEVLPQIFEPFTQADRSLDRSRGGLGLGLAMARGLVELHGGRIRADSEGVDKGAEFTVILPLQAPPTEPPRPAAPEVSHDRPLRILVVDDNQDAADTLRDLLELSGNHAEVAYSGPAALEAARRVRPEVVLCDIGLPQMDGYEVAAALRKDPVTAQARLIAISGYGQEEHQRRAREAGFDWHLTKPVSLEELRRLLR